MQTTTTTTTNPTDFIFLQRIYNYGPVSYYVNWAAEFYTSLKKKYPALKFGLDKVELLLQYVQPLLTNLGKNTLVTKVDEFSCRQLDTLEIGFEATRELVDQDASLVENVKNVSATLAENGKQLVQEKVVKPVGAPVKDYIDTQVELITEKLKAPEVQEKIAPIQEFVLEKAHYVHEQIENNSRFEAIRPHYENALAQVSQVVESLANNLQQDNQETQPKSDPEAEKQEEEGSTPSDEHTREITENEPEAEEKQENQETQPKSEPEAEEQEEEGSTPSDEHTREITENEPEIEEKQELTPTPSKQHSREKLDGAEKRYAFSHQFYTIYNLRAQSERQKNVSASLEKMDS